MHHKSIVLRMALPGSLSIQSDRRTVFRNSKTFELQGVGTLRRDCSVFRELSVRIKFHHISFVSFLFCNKKKKIHTVQDSCQVKSFYAILPTPLGHHYSVQNRSVAAHYTAARLCPFEHNDFYIINTISNNNSTESLFTALAQDQNNITTGREDLKADSSDVT